MKTNWEENEAELRQKWKVETVTYRGFSYFYATISDHLGFQVHDIIMFHLERKLHNQTRRVRKSWKTKALLIT